MNAYSGFSDKNLLVLMSQGNKVAFDEIYERYWEKLFLYVVKVIENSDDAKDIVQDVFVSLWERRQEVTEISSLAAYLFRAVRNRGLTFLAGSKNNAQFAETFAYFNTEVGDFLAEQIAVNELSQILDEEINKLPPKMKEVFVMSRNDNLSYKEISEELSISDKTVKKQINNALKQLRLILSFRRL